MGEVTDKCKHCYVDIHIFKNVWYHPDSQMGQEDDVTKNLLEKC